MANRLITFRRLMIVLSLMISPSMWAAADGWQMNMYKGVTPISKDIYHLHMAVMAICAVIGLVVFGVMIYSLIHHRRSKGHQAANFHDNVKLEIIWSIIPFLILVALAVPATNVLMRMDNTDDADLTIKVVGSQWKWQYQYLDKGISYFSSLSTPYKQLHNTQEKGQWYLLEVDKPLVIPTHKKIRFLVTASDVIHSWWVPQLGIKRDAIPGFMHEAWALVEEPGIYRGQCAELCGVNHGFMPIVVEAVDEATFNQWVSKQPKIEVVNGSERQADVVASDLPFKELMTKGRDKYEQLCAACHKADGLGLPPLFPALKGSSVAVGNPRSRHIDIILNGVSGSAMQGYKDQLSDEDVAAIATYERNAWNNNTGDAVQPKEVAAVRQSANVKPTIVNKAQAGGLQ